MENQRTQWLEKTEMIWVNSSLFKGKVQGAGEKSTPNQPGRTKEQLKQSVRKLNI